VTRTDGLQSLGEAMRSVTAASVGHDTLDLDAVSCEEAASVEQKAGCRAVPLVGVDLDEGQATGVIDRHMNVFVARSNRVPVPASAEALLPRQHASATARRNSAELFGVDVDQLAWMLAKVTNWHSSRAVVVMQAAHPVPVQNSVNSRAGHAKYESQPMRALTQLAPRRQDTLDLFLA
jgi:hypothetical protein